MARPYTPSRSSSPPRTSLPNLTPQAASAILADVSNAGDVPQPGEHGDASKLHSSTPFVAQCSFDRAPRGIDCSDAQTHSENTPYGGKSSDASARTKARPNAKTGNASAAVDDAVVASSPYSHGCSPLILAAHQGDLASLDRLLKQSDIDVNQVDDNFGMSALMVAIEAGQIEVVDALIRQPGINLNLADAAGNSALHWAAFNNKPNAVKCLLQAGADVNLANPRSGATALTLAAEKGRLTIARFLTAQPGIRLDQTRSDGYSALHIAIMQNKLNMVTWLLAVGARVNFAFPLDEITPLIRAASCGQLAMVKALLKRSDIELDTVDTEGHGALHWAAFNNKTEALECLLDAGADVNLVNQNDGSTALMWATREGHLPLVKLLATQPRIQLDLADSSGYCALHEAVATEDCDMVECLLEAGAKVDLPIPGIGMTVLVRAAQRGLVRIVKALLDRPGIKLNGLDVGGRSALHWAAHSNNGEVLKCLLEAGAKVNLATSTDRLTALIVAAGKGHAEVVQILLKRKDIKRDQTDDHGNTALGLAVKLSRAAVVEVFINRGASMEDFDFVAAEPSPFIISIADLIANSEAPADLQANPLGHRGSQCLDQPLAFFDQLGVAIGAGKSLPHWLRDRGIRMAAAVPFVQCLSVLPVIAPRLAQDRNGLNAQQKRLYCASALTRLRVLSAEGKACSVYRDSGISAAAIESLTAVANSQIEALVTVAEQAVAALVGAMLDKLISDCLAKTNVAYQLNEDELGTSLVEAGFIGPVAQAIAMGWKSALAALGDEPVAIPTGLSIKQAMHYLRDNTATRAPALFASALMRELHSQKPLAALRILIGGLRDAEGLDTLFQMQCDQLRQYCAHLMPQHESGAE
jgi:ankyrin repeat protein